MQAHSDFLVHKSRKVTRRKFINIALSNRIKCCFVQFQGFHWNSFFSFRHVWYSLCSEYGFVFEIFSYSLVRSLSIQMKNINEVLLPLWAMMTAWELRIEALVGGNSLICSQELFIYSELWNRCSLFATLVDRSERLILITVGNFGINERQSSLPNRATNQCDLCIH